MFLKERLYKNTMPKTMSKIAQGLTAPKEVTVKEDQSIYNDRPVTKWPVPDRPTTAETLNKSFRSRSQKTDAGHAIAHHTTQL